MKLYIFVYNDYLVDMINRYQCKKVKNIINIWYFRCMFNYIDYKFENV